MQAVLHIQPIRTVSVRRPRGMGEGVANGTPGAVAARMRGYWAVLAPFGGP